MINSNDLVIPKKRGRKRKLTTEQLQDIIEKYAKAKPRLIAFRKTDLAKFANEELGYEGVIPHDFGRNPEIKSLIDDLNEEFNMPKTILKKGNVVDVDINTDKLVDNITNRTHLKQVLGVYNKNYNKLRKEYESLLENFEKIENKRVELLDQIDKIESKYKKEKDLNKQLKEKIEYYENYKFSDEKKFANSLQYLYEKKCCSELDEVSILTMLDRHFKVRRSEKIDFDDIALDSMKESDNDIIESDIDIIESSNENEDNNIISFEKKKQLKYIIDDRFEDDGLFD